MTKLKILLITVISYTLTLTASAQFTKQQAVNFVLNELLSEDELNVVDVYVSINAKSGQEVLILADDESVTYPYDSNWVFFVDDYPPANWHHACRYIFVSTFTGDYTIINKSIYPKAWEDEYEAVSLVNIHEPVVLPVNIETNFTYYPNPFYEQITFQYTINKPAQVELSVSDIQGNLIKCLINKKMKQSQHQVKWDGLDSDGKPCQPGTYIAYLKINGKIQQSIKIINL